MGVSQLIRLGLSTLISGNICNKLDKYLKVSIFLDLIFNIVWFYTPT